MIRKFSVSLTIIADGVFLLTLLQLPSSTAIAAGKPPTKTATPTPVTTPTSTPLPGVPGGWRTSGTQILTPSNQPFLVSGVNWYGFETRDKVAHGMWTKDYKYILDQVKQYGFNTVRIPFSNEMWELNPTPSSSKVSACPECSGKKSARRYGADHQLCGLDWPACYSRQPPFHSREFSRRQRPVVHIRVSGIGLDQ